MKKEVCSERFYSNTKGVSRCLNGYKKGCLDGGKRGIYTVN